MCLQRITKKYEVPDMNERTAYKILIEPSFLNKDYTSPYQEHNYRPGVWLKAYEITLRTEEWVPYTYDELHRKLFDPARNEEAIRECYISGFHCYPSKKEAEKALQLLKEIVDYIIVKVKVRGVTYEGIDGTDRTKEFLEPGIKNLVAKEIMIEEKKSNV